MDFHEQFDEVWYTYTSMIKQINAITVCIVRDD